MFTKCINTLKAFLTGVLEMFKQMEEQQREFAEQDRKEREERRKQKKLQEEERKRQEAEQQKQMLHDQIQHLHNTQLRKLWATALNALPPHMRLVANDIDSIALSNHYLDGVRWELEVTVSVEKKYTPSNLHNLQDTLNSIFSNLLADSIQSFQNRITSDKNLYNEESSKCNPKPAPSVNGVPTSTNLSSDNEYLIKYKSFYSIDCWKLYGINIFDIVADTGKLIFTYDVNYTPLNRFFPGNYYYLVNSI